MVVRASTKQKSKWRETKRRRNQNELLSGSGPRQVPPGLSSPARVTAARHSPPSRAQTDLLSDGSAAILPETTAGQVSEQKLYHSLRSLPLLDGDAYNP